MFHNNDFKKPLQAKVKSTIIHKIFLEILVFVWNSVLRESPISVFLEIFTSTDKIFISGEGLSTRQEFYDVLRFSWYSKSPVLRQLVRHHQKASKYYEHELDPMLYQSLYFICDVNFDKP